MYTRVDGLFGWICWTKVKFVLASTSDRVYCRTLFAFRYTCLFCRFNNGKTSCILSHFTFFVFNLGKSISWLTNILFRIKLREKIKTKARKKNSFSKVHGVNLIWNITCFVLRCYTERRLYLLVGSGSCWKIEGIFMSSHVGWPAFSLAFIF